MSVIEVSQIDSKELKQCVNQVDQSNQSNGEKKQQKIIDNEIQNDIDQVKQIETKEFLPRGFQNQNLNSYLDQNQSKLQNLSINSSSSELGKEILNKSKEIQKYNYISNEDESKINKNLSLQKSSDKQILKHQTAKINVVEQYKRPNSQTQRSEMLRSSSCSAKNSNGLKNLTKRLDFRNQRIQSNSDNDSYQKKSNLNYQNKNQQADLIKNSSQQVVQHMDSRKNVDSKLSHQSIFHSIKKNNRSPSNASHMSFKEALTQHHFQSYKRAIEKQISGILQIELREEELNRIIEENKSDEGFLTNANKILKQKKVQINETQDTIKIDDLNDSNEKDSAIKLQKMVPSQHFFSDLLKQMKQMYDDGVENQDIIEIAHDPNEKRNLWQVVLNAMLGEKSHQRFIQYIIRAKSGNLTYEQQLKRKSFLKYIQSQSQAFQNQENEQNQLSQEQKLQNQKVSSKDYLSQRSITQSRDNYLKNKQKGSQKHKILEKYAELVKDVDNLYMRESTRFQRFKKLINYQNSEEKTAEKIRKYKLYKYNESIQIQEHLQSLIMNKRKKSKKAEEIQNQINEREEFIEDLKNAAKSKVDHKWTDKDPFNISQRQSRINYISKNISKLKQMRRLPSSKEQKQEIFENDNFNNNFIIQNPSSSQFSMRNKQSIIQNRFYTIIQKDENKMKEFEKGNQMINNNNHTLDASEKGKFDKSSTVQNFKLHESDFASTQKNEFNKEIQSKSEQVSNNEIQQINITSPQSLISNEKNQFFAKKNLQILISPQNNTFQKIFQTTKNSFSINIDLKDGIKKQVKDYKTPISKNVNQFNQNQQETEDNYTILNLLELILERISVYKKVVQSSLTYFKQKILNLRKNSSMKNNYPEDYQDKSFEQQLLNFNSVNNLNNNIINYEDQTMRLLTNIQMQKNPRKIKKLKQQLQIIYQRFQYLQFLEIQLKILIQKTEQKDYPTKNFAIKSRRKASNKKRRLILKETEINFKVEMIKQLFQYDQENKQINQNRSISPIDSQFIDINVKHKQFENQKQFLEQKMFKEICQTISPALIFIEKFTGQKVQSDFSIKFILSKKLTQLYENLIQQFIDSQPIINMILEYNQHSSQLTFNTNNCNKDLQEEKLIQESQLVSTKNETILDEVLKNNEKINFENPSFSSINQTSKNKIITLRNLERGSLQNLDTFDVNNNKRTTLKSAAHKDIKNKYVNLDEMFLNRSQKSYEKLNNHQSMKVISQLGEYPPQYDRIFSAQKSLKQRGIAQMKKNNVSSTNLKNINSRKVSSNNQIAQAIYQSCSAQEINRFSNKARKLKEKENKKIFKKQTVVKDEDNVLQYQKESNNKQEDFGIINIKNNNILTQKMTHIIKNNSKMITDFQLKYKNKNNLHQLKFY